MAKVAKKVFEYVVKQRKVDGYWTVARPRSGKPSAVRATRQEALDRAKHLARDGSAVFAVTRTGTKNRVYFTREAANA